MADFTVIPSIDALRQRPAVRALEAQFGVEATLGALRAAAASVRVAIAGGDPALATEDAAVTRIEAAAAVHVREAFRPSLEPVINATGVIVHTNLGRAPLAASAIERVGEVARGYSSLEYDLARGARGRRDVHAEALLCRLTGAEAAVVVNNNAAATMIVLAALAAGREVIVSRGELVEIGGGFRVPDVMAQSGAVLREVGTTNKTRVADYAAAISDRTALILRVHPSNFRIEGFTERPRLTDLVTLGRHFNIPVAEDLGSGHLATGIGRSSDAHPTRIRSASDAHPVGIRSASDAHPVGIRSASDAHQERIGSEPAVEQSVIVPVSDRGQTGVRHQSDPVRNEPAVGDTVAAGVDVCCFSGDKLLGGPQAGIIVGRAAIVDRIRTHPLMRALRVDKMTYAALEATLAEYAAGRAATTVPVQRMLAMTSGEIRERADALASAIGRSPGWRVEVIAGASAIGGGSAPGVELPTWLVAIANDALTPDALEGRLRRLAPPVIARIERDTVVLDPRTVLPAQDAQLVALIQAL
jgi:L-seryl-tRNA(Ser) seleniumtransferase